jgi:outer membrane protein
MRRFAFLCFLLAFSVASAKDFKLAIVDMQKLFNSYPGTQKAKDKLKEIEKKKIDDLNDSQQELSDLGKELTDSSSVLSQKQRSRKEKEYAEKKAAFEQAQAEAQKEMMLQENEMTQTLVDQLKDLVAGVAKDKGFDLVLDKDKTVYAKDAVDLTDDILNGFKNTDTSKDDGSKK